MTQLILIDVDSDWDYPESRPEFKDAKLIVIDVETKDPNLTSKGPGWPTRDGHVAGIVVAIVDRSWNVNVSYYPIGHATGNLDKDWVLSYIRKICASPIPKLFHNGQYDIGWLSTEDCPVSGPHYDTMFAAALIDENRYSYRLDDLGKDWVGVGKDETLLNEAAAVRGIKKSEIKGRMWEFPPKFVGPYAEQDALTTLALWRYVAKRLVEEELWDLFVLEMELLPMIIAMRKQGIRVDVNKAGEIKATLKKKLKERQSALNGQVGLNVDIWASDSIRKAFDSEGLEYGRTEKGAPSFTKEFLEAHPHWMPQEIRYLRKLDKTIGTFAEGMVENHAVNGRIHAEFHPLKSDDGGTITGRGSMSNPNLQQTTAKDLEFGPMVRQLFLPEKNCLWGAFDYKAQEPRLTLHYAFLKNLKGSAEAVQKYHDDPDTDYHQMVATICGLERKDAKAINLGIGYGMGGAALCKELGLPTKWISKESGKWEECDPGFGFEIAGDAGQDILDQYHKNAPFVQGMIDVCSNVAQQRGYIRTLLGRRGRFDSWEPVHGKGKAIRGREKALKEHGAPIRRAFTYRAVNKLIQGSAADMTKKAMVEIWKAGITPMLQMHDELDISVDNEKDARMIKDIMQDCVKLKVPVLVDAEFGKNWAEAKTELNDVNW